MTRAPVQLKLLLVALISLLLVSGPEGPMHMYKDPQFRFPGGNPLVNGLVIVAGLLAIAASIVIGFFAMVVLGSAFVILAAIVGIRLWWYRWKLRRQGLQPDGQQSAGDTMIEGEYTVVVSETRSRQDSET